MTDLIAAFTLLGTPAAALFALRCTVRHQLYKERAGDHSATRPYRHGYIANSPRAL